MIFRKVAERAMIPCIGILILMLFYRTWLVFLALPLLLVFSLKYSGRRDKENYQNDLNIQFKDALISMTAALRAGYSVEKALNEAFREMVIMYGDKAPISEELNTVNNRIHLGVTAEAALKEFAERSGVEDIETFSSVFIIAKRTGGDLVEIISKTASDISAKADTINEIRVLTSAKRLEQNMMAAMPPAIILYINLTSEGILEPLYGNPAGAAIMTVCLAVYVAAIFLGRKIIRIEV